MKNMLQRGFTLIELLVVIAIIGILAAVVIGSLNDARSGGQNASVQQSVANIRAQAEMVYNSSGYSYDDVCIDDRTTGLIQAALDVVNGTAYVAATHGVATYAATNGAAATNRTASCKSDDTRYMVASPLAGGEDFWCVDSTGASEIVTGTTGPAGWTCS